MRRRKAKPAKADRPHELCLLCGKAGTVDSVTHGSRYCFDCREGLDCGDFAAIGVAHEIRGCRNGHVFGFGPGMAELNRGGSMPSSQPKYSHKLALPSFTATNPLTFEALLKAHKKANAKAKAEGGAE